MHLQNVALSSMQPRDQDYLVTQHDSLQCLKKGRFDLHSSVRRVFPPHQVRSDEADRLQRIDLLLVHGYSPDT
jgi:hypothetical protein